MDEATVEMTVEMTVTYAVRLCPDGERWRAVFGDVRAEADEPHLAVAGVLETLAARMRTEAKEGA